MVITCCGPSCGLWLCVDALNRGAPKIFRKLLRHRNHSSEISRAGPATMIIFFLFSVHLVALRREFYGTEASRSREEEERTEEEATSIRKASRRREEEEVGSGEGG